MEYLERKFFAHKPAIWEIVKEILSPFDLRESKLWSSDFEFFNYYQNTVECFICGGTFVQWPFSCDSPTGP